MVTKEQVIEAIKTVIDPHIGVDIYNIGLIYDIKIDNEDVTIKMTLTNPACPMAKSIIGNTKTAVEKLEEVKKVDIDLVFDPPWTPNMLSDDLKKRFGVG